MLPTVDATRLKLVSKPYKNRSGLWPMIVALTIGFSFSVIWFGVATWMMLQNGAEFLTWGILIVLSTVLYCVYLGIAAYKIYADSKRQYCLELTENEAFLSVVDSLREKKSTQMVLLCDVKYGEYYPYTDSSCLILHAPYADMEIPLWPLGAQAQDALDFLEGRGVHIINVQSDEKIPE
ncbi:MAG TPA: hypothetical protein V6D22_16540 [Candidatus Obscuribacterales bacterium]